MMAKHFVVCLLLLVGANALADESSKRAKLQELMQLQGTTQKLELQLAAAEQRARQIGPAMFAEFKKQIPDLDPALLAEMATATSKFIDAAKPSWTAAEAANIWIRLYGEQVTEEELDQIVAYYRSPIGKKDLAANRKAAPGWSAFIAERDERAFNAAKSAYVEDLKRIMRSADQQAQ